MSCDHIGARPSASAIINMAVVDVLVLHWFQSISNFHFLENEHWNIFDKKYIVLGKGRLNMQAANALAQDWCQGISSFQAEHEILLNW